MRILAIRGSNIAALAGPFELDFVSGPLASTGLFAITGPTGAGKSSLLDTMCLALFDKTPRLASDGGAATVGYGSEGGGDSIKSDDPRGLLTRGALDGFAEVDFTGIDGYRYRARWSVHRARKSLALQAQKVAFENLDTRMSLTETKTSTLALITEKLGLDFHQFRRSILLAQGEFSAFLRAKAKERGELLERMTGTDLYARLSKAAYFRASREKDALKDLESQLSVLTVFDDDARKQIDDRIAMMEEVEQTHLAAIKELERGTAWYERQSRLAKSATDSAYALATVFDRWGAHEQPGWCPKTGEPSAIEGFALEVRERITLATKLDALVVDAQKMLSEAETEVLALLKSHQNAQRVAQEAERKAAETRGQLSAIEDWLGNNEDAERMAKNWILYEKELRAFAAAHQKLAELQAQMNALLSRFPAANAAVGSGQSIHAEACARLEAVKESCAEAEAKLLETPIEQVRAQREEGRAKVSLLDTWRTLLGKSHSLGVAVSSAETERASALDMVESLRIQSLRLDARLEQAETDLTRARAVLDLAGRRKELVVGTPCPLCGAIEHPFADHDPGAKSVVDEQLVAIKGLKAERDSCVAELAKQQSRVTTAVEAIKNGTGERSSIVCEIDAAVASWMRLVGEEPGTGPGEEDLLEQAQRLAVKRSDIEEANRVLDVAIREYDALSKKVGEARRAKDLCQAEVDKARKAEEKARETVARLNTDAEKLKQSIDNTTQARDDAQMLLTGVFEGDAWRSELLSDSEAAIKQYRSRVDAFAQKRKALDDCRTRLPAEDVECAAKKEQVAKLEADCEASQGKERERKATLHGYESDRKGLFAGHGVATIERDLLEIERLEAQRIERERSLAEHESENKPARLPEELEALLAEQRAGAKEARAQLEAARGKKNVDDAARAKRDGLLPLVTQQREVAARWGNLDALIGSASGAKFRDFAQGLTLRIVIAHANKHLKELRPRYSLMAVPDQNLEMQVIDHDMGNEVRTIASLSGGEGFLVSLALALGLAASGGNVADVETLFIDEGFGTLDEGAMDAAIAVLDTLRSAGKTIGVISHVERLQDILATHVRVVPAGGGFSTVEIG